MPEGTAPAAPAAPAPAPAAPPASPIDRAAALKEKLMAEESAPEPAAETIPEAASGDESGQASVPSASAADSGVDDTRARAVADRAARIASVRKREAERRKREEDQQRRNAQAAPSSAQLNELETLRKRVQELEPLNGVFASEESLLAAAEAKGMSPEKLVAWMRTRLSDPAAVAERRAKTETDVLRAEVEKLRKENEEWRQAQEKAQADRQHAAEAHHRAVTFLQQAQGRPETHPYVHAFLTQHGPQATIGYANQVVAPMLGDDYTLDELQDHFEQLLEETQFSGARRTLEQPANGVSQASRNGAGQPVTTLSNKVAGERSTVSEAVPLHKMPLDKRVEFLKAKYSRE